MDMTHDDETPLPRAGTGADLARRMDRLEGRVDGIEGRLTVVTTTLTRVEANQQHADKLGELRYNALDTHMKQLDATLGAFIARIDSIISGETQTAQGRAGAELVADFVNWRKELVKEIGVIEDRLPDAGEVEEYRSWRAKVDAFMTQGLLLGRLAVLLISTNVIAIVVAIGAAYNAAQKP